jgi:hypothetical protein
MGWGTRAAYCPMKVERTFTSFTLPRVPVRIPLSKLTKKGTSTVTYGEHDFGEFEAYGERLSFKIDYFDQALNMHSPDPADPAVTTRVITVMLAEEY